MAEEQGEAAGPGRWLDWSAAAAAVLLAVIVADIVTGGRLVSARLARWRGGGEADDGVAGGAAGG